MNPIEKNALRQKIDYEIEQLEELKSEAFARSIQTHSLRDYKEFDRLSAKMDGLFLARGLLLGSASVVTYQERPNKKANQQHIDILSSDRTD